MRLSRKLSFSYSKFSICFAGLILVMGMFISAITPSFQSPDEFDHIKRAYLLTKGTIIFESPAGLSSGGRVDTGLLKYFETYFAIIFKPERKLSLAEVEDAKDVKWSGQRVFSEAPGMSYYFPLLYLPQATGLLVGQVLDLSVDLSYRLARLLNLLTICLLLFLAFNIHRPSPLVLVILLLPMSLFQMSAASIDGMALALTVVCMACFLRIRRDREQSRPALFYALLAAAVVISMGRIYLLPAMVLAFIAAHYLGGKKYYLWCALGTAAILAWVVIILKTSVDYRVPVGASTLGAALLYLQHPGILLNAFYNSIFDSRLFESYAMSFIGALGWLDTLFYAWQYIVFAVLALSVTGLCLNLQGLREDWPIRLTIFLCAVVTILLMFASLLVTWNIYPAKVIQGVQGRYLLMPAVMVAHALSCGAPAFAGARRKIALALVGLMILFTLNTMPRLLIRRYYLAVPAPQKVSLNQTGRPTPHLVASGVSGPAAPQPRPRS